MKLIIKNLTKNFEKKEVLKNINFEFEQGKIYGLLGRNGAGKTTLFNAINEDIEINSGEFYIEEDNNLKALDIDDIGYVFSNPILPEFLTGREFIKFYIEINEEKLQNLKTVDEYLDMVELNYTDRDILMKNYSSGMKNKIQMLLYFISKPKIILLDEPLTSLDVVVASEMKNILKSMKKDHILIFSTHILELATDLCDEIVILNNGNLELIDNELLKTSDFEEKIVRILKDETNV